MLAEILGPDGLILIAVFVIVLLFGGSKLPKLARGLGTASHEFRKGVAEGEHSSTDEIEDDTRKSSPPIVSGQDT
jgi:sec-independent protein translocase protein TatA